jgi:hypothetical protein
VLVVSALVVLFFGCSGDNGGDNGGGDPGKTPGNDFDIAYLMFLNVILRLDEANVDRIQDLLDLYQSVGTGKSNAFPAGALQEPEYHTSSGYWYIEHIDTTFYGIEIGRDSLQFLHSGAPVVEPDSALLTQIRGGSNWVLIDTSLTRASYPLAAGDTLYELHLLVDMVGDPGEIAGAGDVVIDISCTTQGLPPGMSSECQWECDFTGTGEDLTINIRDDTCPTSGHIDYSGESVLSCPPPAPSFSNAWEATQAFDNGTVTWHIENESHYWDTDGYCNWYLSYWYDKRDGL